MPLGIGFGMVIDCIHRYLSNLFAGYEHVYIVSHGLDLTIVARIRAKFVNLIKKDRRSAPATTAGLVG